MNAKDRETLRRATFVCYTIGFLMTNGGLFSIVMGVVELSPSWISTGLLCLISALGVMIIGSAVDGYRKGTLRR